MAKVTRKSRFGNQYQVTTDDCITRLVTRKEYDQIEIGDILESGLLAALAGVAGEDAEMPDPERRAEFRAWTAAWDAGTERARSHIQAAKEAANNGQ